MKSYEMKLCQDCTLQPGSSGKISGVETINNVCSHTVAYIRQVNVNTHKDTVGHSINFVLQMCQSLRFLCWSSAFQHQGVLVSQKCSLSSQYFPLNKCVKLWKSGMIDCCVDLQNFLILTDKLWKPQPIYFPNLPLVTIFFDSQRREKVITVK